MNKLQLLLTAFFCALCVSSCSSNTDKTSESPAQPSATPDHTKLINSYFTDLLKGHKIENIEESDTGIFLPNCNVGLEGQVTQIRPLSESGNLAAELEVKVTLPDRRVVSEVLAGAGDTTNETDAVKSALQNFTMTTFHPIYAAFIDEKDPHVQRMKWTINGKEREVILGDSLETVYKKELADTTARESHDTSAAQAWWEERFKQAVCARKLDDQDHWAKFFIAENDGKVAQVAATLDNSPDPEMTKFFEQLDHPKGAGSMYTIKQFVVVRRTDRK